MAHIDSIVVRSQSRKDGGSVVLSWGVEAAIQMATMGGVVARARATVSSHFAVCVRRSCNLYSHNRDSTPDATRSC